MNHDEPDVKPEIAPEIPTKVQVDTEAEAESDLQRETRRILRSVQDHLYHAHTNLGALRETVGMVDVLRHPTNSLSTLNYVTPRRKTAWISRTHVEQGLAHLRKYGRTPRVQYIEGLFPPLFAKTLHDLNLHVERETPMMIYIPQGFNGVTPSTPIQGELPDGVTIERVTDQRGIELWWYVWRNAFYDVLTLGVEPLFVGRDMAALTMGYQVDFLLYRYGFPAGVARLSIQDQTAHILALALLKEARTPELTRALQVALIREAVNRKSEMIFAPGETENDRRLCRDLGFVDFGSIVCYAAEEAQKDADDKPLEQPILPI